MKASAMMEVVENYDVPTAEAAAEAFKEVYDRYPDFIDDKPLNGICTVCGKVIFEGTPYYRGDHGKVRCQGCTGPDRPVEEKTYQVKSSELPAETGNWLV